MLVNYLADVLPVWRRLQAPTCSVCQLRQPLLNYFLWPRRCPSCGSRRKIRTWIVEILAVLLAIWLWQQPSAELGLLPALLLLVYFGVVAVIDLEHHLILHPTSLVGAVLGLAVGSWLHGIGRTLLGGLAGFGIMLLLFFLGGLFVRVIILRRRPDFSEGALGFGDVILAGILGLFVGWPGILLCLVVGILLGGLGAILYLIWSLAFGRFRAFTFLPYGPFLLAGAFILLFFRDQLLALAN